MKNILKTVSVLILMSLMISIVGASPDYVRDPNNVTGMDEATVDDLLKELHPELYNNTEQTAPLRGSATPSSATWTQDNLVYTISNDRCIVSKYTGDATDLIIPVHTVIDGVSYTTCINSTGTNALFRNSSTIVTVQFGTPSDTDCIVGLSYYLAFQNCSNLESVKFIAVTSDNGASITSCFERCPKLYDVQF